jgi:uncharacterized protein YcbK (DUF882 family)
MANPESDSSIGKPRPSIGDIILTLHQIASPSPEQTCPATHQVNSRKRFWSVLAVALFAAALLAPSAHAGTSTLAPGEMGTTDAVPATGQQYHLKLHHLHSGESLDVVYRIGDTYLPAAMAQLNHFLRDHRTQEASHYDPKEFDLLHNLMTRLGRPDGEIDVVCGYRTPWSNNFLRTRSASTGVAKNSQHMQAKAIDIRVPGVTTSKLRDIALSLAAGGVGYYPVSQFVHVDVGPVRHWTFAGRGDN